MPHAIKANKGVSVPEDTPMACFTEQNSCYAVALKCFNKRTEDKRPAFRLPLKRPYLFHPEYFHSAAWAYPKQKSAIDEMIVIHEQLYFSS